jgi:hypothetical protein
MSREATCPACEGRVPVPKSARYNVPVSCPMCDEAFVPPWLRVRVVEEDEEGSEPYDPETAERYGMKKAVGKKVRPKVSTRGSVEDNDRRWKPQRGGGMGGKVLLGMGIGLGLVIPLSYLIGKWALTKNVGIVEASLAIIAVLVGILLVGAGLGLFANRFRAMMNRIFGGD